MIRLLITGGDGTVGTALRRAVAADERTRSWELLSVSVADFDIADRAAVAASVESFAPDVVVHLAALAVLDACEDDVARALEVNVQGTANVARAARDAGARLVYLSSDYVFDGVAPPPGGYVEDDVPNPVSVYGLTKLASERIVQSVPEHLVVRTSWVFGGTDPALDQVREMLDRTESGAEVVAIHDQVGSPTDADHLGRALVELILDGATGCLHVAGAAPGTWFEVAGVVIDTAARVAPTSRAGRRRAVAIADTGLRARRPVDSALDVTAAARRGVAIPGWDQTVAPLVARTLDPAGGTAR